MANTPVFNWPYQSRLDAAHGPNLGEKLALAIEATVAPHVGPRTGVSLRRVANQALPDSTPTDVIWDTEDADTTGTMWSAGTPTIITIPATGLWVFTLGLALNTNSTGRSFADMPGGRYALAYAENAFAVTGFAILAMGTTFSISAFVDTAAGANMTGSFNCYRVGI